MISSKVSDIFDHRLKKLAKSGLSAQDLEQQIHQILEGERCRKAQSDEPERDSILPIRVGCKAHLNVV